MAYPALKGMGLTTFLILSHLAILMWSVKQKLALTILAMTLFWVTLTFAMMVSGSSQDFNKGIFKTVQSYGFDLLQPLAGFNPNAMQFTILGFALASLIGLIFVLDQVRPTTDTTHYEGF